MTVNPVDWETGEGLKEPTFIPALPEPPKTRAERQLIRMRDAAIKASASGVVKALSKPTVSMQLDVELKSNLDVVWAPDPACAPRRDRRSVRRSVDEQHCRTVAAVGLEAADLSGVAHSTHAPAERPIASRDRTP
jgi:hypothetical protein